MEENELTWQECQYIAHAADKYAEDEMGSEKWSALIKAWKEACSVYRSNPSIAHRAGCQTCAVVTLAFRLEQ